MCKIRFASIRYTVFKVSPSVGACASCGLVDSFEFTSPFLLFPCRLDRERERSFWVDCLLLIDYWFSRRWSVVWMPVRMMFRGSACCVWWRVAAFSRIGPLSVELACDDDMSENIATISFRCWTLRSWTSDFCNIVRFIKYRIFFRLAWC